MPETFHCPSERTDPRSTDWFVVDPFEVTARGEGGQRLFTDGWPAEDNRVRPRNDGMAEVKDRAHDRVPRELADFDEEREKIGEDLAQFGIGKLTDAECIALRLYTGPTFVKYNALLRGLGLSKVPFFVRSMLQLRCSQLNMLEASARSPEASEIRFSAMHILSRSSLRCCDKAVFSEWEAAKDDRSWEKAMLNLNRYPTTITTISAAIRKLSQLTKVGSEPLAHWLLP